MAIFFILTGSRKGSRCRSTKETSEKRQERCEETSSKRYPFKPKTAKSKPDTEAEDTGKPEGFHSVRDIPQFWNSYT